MKTNVGVSFGDRRNMAIEIPQVIQNALKNLAELFVQEIGRSGASNVGARLKANVDRLPTGTLKAAGEIAFLVGPFTKSSVQTLLRPLGVTQATLAAETWEQFWHKLSEKLKTMGPGPTDDAVRSAARDAATEAASWYDVRAEIVRDVNANPINFNARAMAELGGVEEQERIMRLVNEGIYIMATSPDPSDLVLLTDIELNTSERLRNFAQAVVQARGTARPHSMLMGVAATMTNRDSMVVRATVGEARKAAFGAAGWLWDRFREDVRPALGAATRYEAPQRTPNKGWFKWLNPTPDWSFREGNIRMKFEWLTELLAGLVKKWVGVEVVTMTVFALCALVMVGVGSWSPVGGMVIASVGAFAGMLAFIAHIIYAPLAIDVGRLLVGTPLLLVNEVLNLFREEPMTLTTDGQSVQNLRDIRWRVAYASLGLPMFLMMSSMIVGPNALALTAAFGIGGVSAVVAVAAHFVKDEDLNRKMMLGTMVGFPLIFVTSLISVANASVYYDWDTTRQFNELFIAGMKNLGAMLYMSLPVLVASIVLLASLFGYGTRIITMSMKQRMWAGVGIIMLSLAVWGLMKLIPARETPILIVPAHMQRAVGVSEPAESGSYKAAEEEPSSNETSSDPWSDQEVGNF
ncbi:MAG: hypothetical protein HYZ07_01435 [Candidatus Harrisonbacteria bacterium]|nr:hypothetical protein [Candidatus Harrisonbacteria bacterium]